MRINDDELQGSGDLVYYEGQLFTGTAVDHHKNGNLAAEIDYVEGLTHGHWREWSDTGVLLIESECQKGVRHGTTKTYFADKRLKSQAEYEYGIETSLKEWDKNGDLILSRTLGPETPGANYQLLEKFRSRNK